MSSIQTDKATLRRELRARRRALSAVAQERHSRLITESVVRQNWFQSAGHIALYMAADGEPDLMPLAKRCWTLGKSVYLPRIGQNGYMVFALYRRGDQLRRNRFGIPEPLPARAAIAADRLDIVLMPLVGFTEQGGRLGMGGGYYDRYFQRRRVHKKTPTLVGIAHECQRCEALPIDAWDVGITLCITESTLNRRCI